MTKKKDEVKKDNKKENKELIKLKEELASEKEKSLRIQAEMVNMRRRQEEEIAKFRKYEGEELIINILNIVDNFERAIGLDDTNLDDELSKFLSGFKMIYGNLLSYLKSIGVEEIEALNKPFDPNFMEAVVMENIIEEEQGIVLDIFQKGYKYKDKVIRPAMVKVNE
ncbi:MAG: nucleotide exchange factor GrpE [Mollicutes bacterium]|jgi:molecular chaperone GrpE|nr:nucleotide exchange factor GrpE [Mollicutes bacterium]